MNVLKHFIVSNAADCVVVKLYDEIFSWREIIWKKNMANKSWKVQKIAIGRVNQRHCLFFIIRIQILSFAALGELDKAVIFGFGQSYGGGVQSMQLRQEPAKDG